MGNSVLDRIFRLSENHTTVRTELFSGITTFLTMAYIIFVQPSVLSGRMFGTETGMDFGAVTAATCLSAALATTVMALYARYPIAQAPGMGENFFFVLSVLPAAQTAGFEEPWRVALGTVFISGLLFLFLTFFTNIRERLIESISPSMKNAIAVGIGLFIAFIGLQNSGIILKDPGTAVKLNLHFASPDLIVFYFGFILTAVLHIRRVPGSILLGILGATLLSILLRMSLLHLPFSFSGSEAIATSMLAERFEIAHTVVSKPPSLSPLFLKMDLAGALSAAMIPFIIVFLFMDVFDTLGTLIGVSEQAGFIKANKLPRAERALASDAIGTAVGAALGTSTVTSFIESAAGVEQGGRTGLTGMVVALLFLLSLFFAPLIAMIGSYPPITAPALVVVGSMMIRHVEKINWADGSESIPAFITMIGIPFSYSIADGLALGLVAYSIIKILSGKKNEANWLTHIVGFLLLLYFILVRSAI